LVGGLIKPLDQVFVIASRDPGGIQIHARGEWKNQVDATIGAPDSE